MTASAGDRGAWTRPLSKSKLLAFRQCERRLWLELNRPEDRADTQSAQARFDAGHRVGDIARRLYDPMNRGSLIEPLTEGFAQALHRSAALLATPRPIFEAGFSAAGAIAFADVMLPIKSGKQQAWRMIEVKSSTSVKDYHRDDVAIQVHVARSAGVPLTAIAVACVDTNWVYPGGGDYRGLLAEQDLTVEAFARSNEVQSWIDAAQVVAKKRKEPSLSTGAHCTSPFECGFISYCSASEPQAEYPVAWLPRVQTKALKAHLAQNGVLDMRDVPDDLLNARQLRVKAQTLKGKPFFDRKGAKSSLAPFEAPLLFLDFETVQFAVPIWAGTKPYQQLPFQFSLHQLKADGTLAHHEFLDLSGADPSATFVDALVKACGARGAVFVYNAAFEKSRIKELAARFPKFKVKLSSLSARVVDLLPIAEAHYYHPSQQGSWSIKKLLPAVVPSLRYDSLDGVQDGGAAMAAYFEAINSETQAARRADIRAQLLAYCGLDTYAMVKLWQVFANRQDLPL